MLTPITGVDPFARRPVARGSIAPVPVTRPASLAEDRAALAAADMQAARTDLFVSRLMVVLCVVCAVMLWVAAPFLGLRLVVRASLLAVIAGCYFGLSWQLLARGYTAGMRWRRWLNATLEPTFATAAIGMIAVTTGAGDAATTPAFLLYPLVIAVSVCRMRPALCLYVAAIGALQYLLLYHAVLAPALEPETMALVRGATPPAALERVFWLALLAGVLAVATHRLRDLAMAGGSETWRRRQIEREFERYVSPDVMQAIMRGDAAPGLAERREVTVLFCDLRDFTGLCEQQAPEHVVALLNTFYEEACQIVRAHGGTVNKLLGDGMLALFGAPDEHPNHAIAAAEAAHEILYAVDRLRGHGGIWQYLDVGIGLDTGPVVCGPIGASHRLEYTAIGSVVNRAARLQSLSRNAGRRIVVSSDCVQHLGRRANVALFGDVKLKGFAEPVPVYVFRHS